ncbi:potassium-transporting ATPase subunit KdpC [Frigidibacter albus]|uniref:Potassium-transporting ATPase KdpC subunit n=1 Tax=Frigidibacter albus TaxID=1465486 RepID=A0A6L8VCW3_9RHOB|nr:potassium-transporting ATPase subunit KdpC [Frigidibacter albus]MZQ87531.1 potassium-transporting ATPase subunit KdpC [Frigidibacter albus]NBE29437.1 potassium-transporting ATPase subunit KdpC [Frigidibacter albus]GGH44916.1 potassium-transporting ATPase KdpC subunit [Frigidibacter albus]
MLTHLRPAITLMLGFTLLTGLAYPLAMTGLAQTLFPAAADGSLITQGDRVIGSGLVAQPFAEAAYLHPRPSASDWNAAGTGASNLGPTSALLVATVAERRAAWEAENGAAAAIDAVTASGSGLDPHVSPQTALAQADRIAAARGADPAAVRALIAGRVEGRALWLYGEPRVNVLQANLALDEGFPMPMPRTDDTAAE